MVLQLDQDLDLGRDKERMTPEDARRQEVSANRLLQAFSAPLADRREIQLLADEVGLGKTFVALAVAYSLLRVIRNQPELAEKADLDKCYRAAVVVVPSGNRALAHKWHQEVEALRTRCSVDYRRTDWFHSRICDNAYELVEGLRRASDLRRKPSENPCVLICTANIFTRQVRDLSDRLRFLAACLFRWWGGKLTMHERYRLAIRAGEVGRFSSWKQYARRVGTGKYEVRLWDFKEHEQYLSPSERENRIRRETLQRLYEQTPFSYSEIAAALDSLAETDEGQALLYDRSTRIREGCEEPAGLLPFCKYAAKRRGYVEWFFDGFKVRLLHLYKELAQHLIRQDIPLVIVDEAHHWRHKKRQDCQSFQRRLAPYARRLLLLTATPFQLHRDELLEVLSVADAMEPAIGADRVALLRSFRESIQKAAEESETAGQEFSREWGALREQFAQVDPRFDTANGIVPGLTDPRTEELDRIWARLCKDESGGESEACHDIPGPLRPFFARAKRLQACNRRLSEALRHLMIRHRRPVEHRRFLIGREYPAPQHGLFRPDQHILHLAPGRVIPPHAELAQYLLMKVVADISRGRHRTTLGMDITGCYTTLWVSKEGKKAAMAAMANQNKQLFRILQRLTGHRSSGENRQDRRHPKLQLVLEETLRRWDQGEKTLIFCFRVPTAQTLKRLLAKGVEQRLGQSRRALLESRGTKVDSRADISRAMQQFRRSLTAREGSGVLLFLDRVLLGWFQMNGLPLPVLTVPDRQQVARLYARAQLRGKPLFRSGERLRLDRIFLNRAIEHVWARRLLNDRTLWGETCPPDLRERTIDLLSLIADEEWIKFRYGDQLLSHRSVQASDDAASTESGVRSSLSTRYDLRETPEDEAVAEVERALSTEGSGERASLAETLIGGPNLLVPLGSGMELLDEAGCDQVKEMCRLMWRITCPTMQEDEDSPPEAWEWQERADVFDAIVRALLREDILLRLPTHVFQASDETWAASIMRGLHEPLGGGQVESLAGRVKEFLRELAEMGPTEREAHLRYAMNPRAESVVLVTGESGVDRDAVFNGFNTPLLPDILICTQVGQEGIDLHRHCRHVVHYDLGWNPATLEQRTGRADRLGSMAMRERKLAQEREMHPLPTLDIGLPYLAGTYDERMYDRLRSRAQAFEILTGGDPSAERKREDWWLDPDDIGASDGSSYVPLPLRMLEQLRVNLAVSTCDSRVGVTPTL